MNLAFTSTKEINSRSLKISLKPAEKIKGENFLNTF
jgi:hypothetical protein